MSDPHDAQPDQPIKVSATEARQGLLLGRMRYVLAFSTVLAIVALGLAFAFA